MLFPPEDLPYLYYVGRPKAKLRYSFPGTFVRDPATVDRRGYVFGSSVNVDEPDLRRHPLYSRAHPVRAVINPGVSFSTLLVATSASYICCTQRIPVVSHKIA